MGSRTSFAIGLVAKLGITVGKKFFDGFSLASCAVKKKMSGCFSLAKFQEVGWVATKASLRYCYAQSKNVASREN